MTNKTCSFFGHRDVLITDEIKEKVKNTIENLIVESNVRIFLFGSKSNFDNLCLMIVSELKEKYADIRRIAYTCKSEACLIEKDREKWEKIYSRLNINDLLYVEEEREFKNKHIANRASYIERNQAMIDDSDFCVFYYDEKYLPEMKKYSKRSIGYYQPKSGTSLAYQYAKRKKKNIINLI